MTKIKKALTALIAACLVFAVPLGAGCNVESPDSIPGPSGGGSGGDTDDTGDTGDAGDKEDPEIPQTPQGAVKITTAAGHLETSYVQWTPVAGAKWYNTYYREQTEGGEWIKLDKELTREYTDYFRADAVGLKAGKYEMKVVPTGSDGEEVTDLAGTAQNIVVAAHVREGFAFVTETGARCVPGAYNEDGTLKDNAQVIYVTNDNKDTVSLDVVYNNKGNTVTCTGIQNIFTEGYAKGYETTPLVVRFIGNIGIPAVTLDGDLEFCNGTTKIKGAPITVEGIGDDTVANGWCVKVKNSSMVEVRNMAFMNCESDEGDNVSLTQGNDHTWVHNCDMFYGGPGGDSDQAKGDGALDTKRSTYITHSFNHFWDSGKCNLQGLKEGDETGNLISYHHNWYDHSDSRHPRIRAATVHVYNNYYDGNAKYGMGATLGASVFSESNYFRSTANMKPMLMAMQGSDLLYAEDKTKGTFGGEDGGVIKSFGNYFDCPEGKLKLFTQETASAITEIDCYEVKTRDETVPDTVVTQKGSKKYNNFDTASSMYSYTVDTAEEARAKVVKYAGRVGGGDLKFVFDNAKEDGNSSVIPELKALLLNYKTKIKAIGGVELKNK